MTEENKQQDAVGTVNEPSELEVCKKQIEEYLNNWKRERADFVNYRKDEAKRVEEFIKFANKDLILDMIDFYDDFLVAYEKLMPLRINKELNNWADGLLKVGEKFRDILRKYEVERIKIGKVFNPELHEAVNIEPGGEKIKEVRAGYTMCGKVIRPTRIEIIK